MGCGFGCQLFCIFARLHFAPAAFSAAGTCKCAHHAMLGVTARSRKPFRPITRRKSDHLSIGVRYRRHHAARFIFARAGRQVLGCGDLGLGGRGWRRVAQAVRGASHQNTYINHPPIMMLRKRCGVTTAAIPATTSPMNDPRMAATWALTLPCRIAQIARTRLIAVSTARL